MNENADSGFCVSCGVARNYGGTCDYCGRLYIEPVEASSQVKRLTALPAKYKISKENNGTAITWGWAGRSGWILIPFAMFWIAITYPIAADWFKEPFDTVPITLLPLVVGVVLFCYALMRLINNTSIYASNQSMLIRHHPIPWRGKLKVDTRDIEQVFVTRIQRSNKETSWHAPALQLITKGGQRHELLRGKAEAEFTDFESLRLIILKALGITPETIAGAHDSFS